MALLADTARPDEIDTADFDAIYLTGGHAVMWDFPDSLGLQRLTCDIWEHGGVVSSVCHPPWQTEDTTRRVPRCRR